MLKKVFFFIIFLISTSSFLSSQNLVTNGDFESFSSLPLNYGDFCLVTGWINPAACCSLNPNYGTPDFVHKNAAWPVGCPNNGFGTINPRSGNGIVGFTTYANYGTPPVFREYISRKLNTHLNIGQNYTVAFYIARAANPYFKYATNNIGVYFSTLAPVQAGTTVLAVSPQWEYTSVFSGSIWTLMTFNFMAADTFNYITLGNFRSDGATTKTVINASALGLYSHYFVEDISVIAGSPLPVELISFNLKNGSPGVTISWATASEKNNDYFTVERSPDMIDFGEIEKVEGMHNSNILHTYEITDHLPLHGTSYYRLRQNDFNGDHSYSEIKSITLSSGAGDVPVWFDKSINNIILELPEGQTGDITISLYDITGKNCFTSVNPGKGRILFHAAHLAKGVYTALLQSSMQVSVKKIFIY